MRGEGQGLRRFADVPDWRNIKAGKWRFWCLWFMVLHIFSVMFSTSVLW